MADVKRTSRLPGALSIYQMSRKGVLGKRPDALNALETGAGVGAGFLSGAFVGEGKPLYAAGMAALGTLPSLERTVNAVRLGMKAVDKADIHPTAKQEIKRLLTNQAVFEGMSAAARIIPAAIAGDALRGGDRSSAASAALTGSATSLGLNFGRFTDLRRGPPISRDDAKKIEAFIKNAAKKPTGAKRVAQGLGLGAAAAAAVGLSHPAGRRRAKRIFNVLRNASRRYQQHARPGSGVPHPKAQTPPSELQKIRTKAEFRKAWHAEAMKHHPDRGGNPEKMKEVNTAYEAFRRSPHYEKLAAAYWPFLARTLAGQGR